MKNTLSIFVGSDEFVCSQFFDVDQQVDGIDISIDDKQVGEILNISIPDASDEEELEKFEDEVVTWLNVNYY